MKRVVITGANGFIGSSLIKYLTSKGIKVIAIVKGECTSIQNELVRTISTENFLEEKDKIKDFNADVFFHLGWNGVSGEDRNSYKVQLDNIENTIEYMYFAKEVNCKKFVFVGSIMEQETYLTAFENGCEPGLGYIYGASKLCAHSICKSLSKEINLPFVWAGITNTYGIGEKSKRLINTTLNKMILGEDLEFTSGIQNYDFVYIDDAVRALYLIGEKGKAFNEYLIGSSSPKPLRAFLEELVDVLNFRGKVSFGSIPFTGVNLPIDMFNCENTRQDIGFIPEISFRDGILKTFSWLKSSQED